MDVRTQLLRFLPHAAVAAALIWLLLARGHAWLGRLAQSAAAMPRRRFLAVAVGAALVVRLALVPVIRPAYDADVREYCEKAAAIATDGNPRAQETRPDGSRFYRTLGYSLPLAGWYRVTGMPRTPDGRVRSAQAFNVLAACGVVVLLVALGAAIGRDLAGRVAALVYATFLPAAAFALLPYTETWTTLLVVAAVLAFERTRRADGGAAVAWGAALGLAEGLLLVTRTEFAALPLVAALWLLAERRGRALAPLAASLVLLAVPFAVNHEMRDGYPGRLRTSVQGGLILYFGNNPIAVNGYGNATPAVVRHVRESYAADPTGASAAAEAVAWMEAHPGRVVLNSPKKLYHLWLGEPQGFTWQILGAREHGAMRLAADALRHAAWIQGLCLLALGVAGLVRRGAGFAPWTTIVVLHAATWCALASSPRNRYPLEPLLMIAAAAWLEAARRESSG